MSDNFNNKNVGENEIDLIDLFRKMGRGIGNMFRSIWKGVLISTVFMIRHWFPLAISLVLGLGTSYLLKLSSPSFFTSDMVLKSNAVPAADMISYINRLHIYCKEKNYNALANSILLSPEQISNILDIGAFWIIDKGYDGIPDEVDYNNDHNVYDTLNVRIDDRLDIRIRIKSPQELINVKTGILHFINSDSLFQQTNRIRLKQKNALIARLDGDILLLDSLQKVKYFEELKNRQIIPNSQMIFLQDQKTQLVYEDIYKLYARKQLLETENELYKDIITVLSEFSVPARRINGAGYYAMRVLPLFFGITLLVLILRVSRKRLRDIYNKY